MEQNKQVPEIKLIALDMDGTLLNEKHEISIENQKAIREAKEKGIEVILSTGRSNMTARDYANLLELNSHLITVNGSEVWGPDGEIVERNTLESGHIQWLWDLTQSHKTKFWATSLNKVWRNEMPEDLAGQEWLKFGFEIEDDEVRALISKMVQDKGMFEISNSSLINIEINALGINKAKAIHIVCSQLGISMENVMACGDSLNDIAMIKEAGWGVAMGNAQEIVKETADAVTATNEEHGVAQAIRKWAL